MVVVREGFDQIDLIYDERSQLARTVISRMTIKNARPCRGADGKVQWEHRPDEQF